MPPSLRASARALPWWHRPTAVLHPARWPLAFGLLAFAAVWLSHLGHVALTPPTDNIEQLTWMRSLEWGYYKHPPLPTWLLAAVSGVLGWSALSSCVLGAACTLGAVALSASVLKDSVGPRFAWLSVLAVLCITFYNGRLNYFNHNTVLTLWVALSAWLWWRLLTRPHLAWWLALGAVAGLALLSKYQFAVTGLASLWLVLRLGLWRNPLHRQGMLLAGALAALVFMPHVLWLQAQVHTPMDYAMRSSLGAHLDPAQRLAHAGLWLADWLFNRCLLAVLLVLVAWGAARSTAPPTQHTPNGATPSAHARAGWHLLMAWGGIPPAFMLVLGVVGGVDLQLHWGTAFALWTPPALMLALGLREHHLNRSVLRVVCVVFVAMQAALLWQSHRTSALGTHPTVPAHWRQFPAQALANAVAEPARQALGGPIDIISGPMAASGAVALLLPEQPRVLIDGNTDISPWIDPHALSGQRILELWPPGTGPTHAQPAPGGWHWSTSDHDPNDRPPSTDHTRTRTSPLIHTLTQRLHGEAGELAWLDHPTTAEEPAP